MKKSKRTNYLAQICLAVLFANINLTYAKEFIIGVEEVSYYPLYDFSATNESRPSYSKDLLTAFFKQHNYSYRFVALPIKRFNKWYVEKGIDFKFPDNMIWRDDKQNKLNITFSQSVIELMAGSYVLASNAKYRRDDVKRLATIFGFSPTLWFDKVATKEIELIEENSPLSIVKHVLHGNVDATNIDSNVIRHNLKLLKNPQTIILNTHIKHEVFSYYLSSIKHPEIIKQFDDFLQNNAKLVLQLKKKYGIIEDF
ncbi:hypothetical protein A9Q74_15785 [Colwellia sp. 39_35_sub15_T18]|nr:hypothetical protein A9Q74_15785 [Colwellia sp. 39_35_sub15_T18]